MMEDLDLIPSNEILVAGFTDYLGRERHLAPGTIHCYSVDLASFGDFLGRFNSGPRGGRPPHETPSPPGHPTDLSGNDSSGKNPPPPERQREAGNFPGRPRPLD